jgi:hypothetical protein
MAFTYSRSITIDHTKCGSSDSSNFPVLVSLSDVTLKTVGNSGHVQNSNGYDIYFYSDSGMTTRLAVERESYDGSAGTYVGWVNVPAVSHTSDIVIYIAYGDAGISTDPNSDGTYGKTSVWDSNYKLVAHLPDGTSLTANDSTSNGNNGTNSGATAATGKIDGGASFSGSAGISLGTDTSLDFSDAFTISAWIKTSQSVGAIVSLRTSAYGESPLIDFMVGFDGVSTSYSNLMLIVRGNTGLYANFQYGAGYVSDNNWHYVTAQRLDSSAISVTLDNGSPSVVGYIPAAITTSLSTSYRGIGIESDWVATNFGSSNQRNFLGSIDEVRLSNIARSADWILTEYNNQNSPSTFYTLGSESGGASSLTIQDSGSASSADNVVLTQASGAFAIADSGSASSADNVTITRNGGDLTIADAGSSSSADNFSLIGNLIIQDSGSSSSSDNVVITRNGGDLTIQDSGSLSSADNVTITLGGTNNFIINDSGSTSSADNVVITRNGGDFTIADSGSASGADNVSLIGNFQIANSGSSSSADNVALVGNLIIQDSGSTSSADTPTLAQAGTNNFIIDDSGSASSADNVTIALNSGLFAISDAGSSSSADNVVLTFNGATFAIDNSGSTSSADNVTITQPSAYALNANLFVNTGDIAVQFTGLKMSSWNTANRPPPVEGLFGFNTETKAIEVYQGGIWN